MNRYPYRPTLLLWKRVNDASVSLEYAALKLKITPKALATAEQGGVVSPADQRLIEDYFRAPLAELQEEIDEDTYREGLEFPSPQAKIEILNQHLFADELIAAAM